MSVILNLKRSMRNTVMSVIKNLNVNKGVGLDSIPAKCIKDGSSIIVKPLSHVINLSIKTGCVPLDWKSAKVVPIY